MDANQIIQNYFLKTDPEAKKYEGLKAFTDWLIATADEILRTADEYNIPLEVLHRKLQTVITMLCIAKNAQE